jgi:hypothetical protein
MNIAQRATSATITAGSTIAAGYATVDRFYTYCTGANVTAARVAGSGNVKNLLRITGASGVTAVGVGQRIESLNSYDLAGQTCVLSVDMSNSLLTTVTWTAYYANTEDTFGTLAIPTRTQIATGTFTVNSTLTRYSTTIAIPSAATTGIEIVFTVGAQTSGTWDITNVQLEPGTVATPFEYKHVGHEIVLCQRYYQKSYDLETAVGTATNTGVVNHNYQVLSNFGTVMIYFPVRMRATPTATNYRTDVANTVGGRYWNGSAEVSFTGSMNGWSSSQSSIRFNKDATNSTNMIFQWTASAEL